jgi:anti-sigma B factor antagonist
MSQGAKEIFMLNTTVQKLGDTTVLRCQGRIVVGDAHAILRHAVLSQTCTWMLVVDLAQVDRIDAGGLGVLLGLRQWAYSHAIRLRLMNVMNQVEQVLQLTKLDRVFEFCSVRDMFCLLHPEGAMAPRSVEPANQRTLKNTFNCSARRQDAPPVVDRYSLVPAAAPGAQTLATVPAEVRESA